MSKADVISGSLALILTGVGYFVGGPGLAAFCIALGVVGIIAVRSWSNNDDRPEVVIEFDKSHLPFDARNRWVGERPIFLRNVGKSHAYDVCLEAVIFDFGTAIQKTPIPVIGPNQTIPVSPDIKATHEDISGVSAFEVLLQVKWVVAGYGEIEVPVRICYRDSKGNNFFTDAVVRYGLGSGAVGTKFRFKAGKPKKAAAPTPI